MSSPPYDRPNEPIAVIGCGLRFPGGADTPDKLWELLREPRDVQSVIPANRFNSDGFIHCENEYGGSSNTRHGYFLTQNYREFDAQFFGIKPIEANSMDPQQRLLLEVVYEGIEAAGLSMESLRGSSTAVYVGLMAVDYTDLLNRDTSDFPPYIAAGTARSMTSNRVSYCFDWRGPSMTIDTACSSSLVAVHQAVQSLRSGDSRIAVAAGTNLLLGPEQFIAGSNMKMLSPDGRSYMWDTRANGYARGEGVAAVILKTLSAATADGDDIECVIVETGLNQDGRTKGLTVPSAAAQATLIDTTYRKAGLDLAKAYDRPQYFEAHGTGTPTGDPIEAEAIHRAFFKNSESSDATDHLYVGSIKTVIGHTEGTAGLAGLIKASLALKHGIIPPNLLFENLAPAVKPFYDNLEIVTNAKPWPELPKGVVRRASVNSFGFGGTNVHCVLESYAPETSSQAESSMLYSPFVFSAPTNKALSAVLASYSHHLRANTSIGLRALSHTLCTRRNVFPIRAAFSAREVGELCAKLDFFVAGIKTKPSVAVSTCATPLRILGVFTGQGAQWAGMATKLLQFPAAMKIIDDLEQSLAELPDPPQWSLRAELSADKSSSRITDAAVAQPACTAVQILLLELMRAAGIRFSAVVGHSSGEIAAAYAAGYLSARDAIRIAYYRGVHLPLVRGKNGETGTMIAIGASYEEAENICNLDEFRGKICVAASNSASSVTLSGDVAAIKSVRDMFQARNMFARLLRIDNAYHSHHMIACSEAITASLRACKIQALQPTNPDCLWVSSVYQRDILMVTDDLNDIYWHSNTIGPVLFSQALECALRTSSFDLAVEVGAHPALKGPASQVIQGTLGHTIPYTGMLSRNVDDVEAFSNGLGYIWANTSDNVIDFAGYYRLLGASESPRILKGLPTYPWDHERAFWHESRISKAFRHQRSRHELLGIRSLNYAEDQMSWKNYLVPQEMSWISGHQIQGQVIFPSAGYMSSAFEAAREVVEDQPVKLIELFDFTFGQPLVFDSEESRVEVVISLTDIRRGESGLTAHFRYHSIAKNRSGPMSLNASGQVNVVFGYPGAGCLQSAPEPQFGMLKVDTEMFYDSIASCGYHYTGSFKALTFIERKVGVAAGTVQIPETVPGRSLLIHPATLDAAMQSTLVAYCYPGDGRLVSVSLPTGVSKVSINPMQALSSSRAQTLRFASYCSDDAEQSNGGVDLYPVDGLNAVLQLEGLRTKPMVPATPKDDIQMVSETTWGPASPTSEITIDEPHASEVGTEKYLQQVAATIEQISHRYPAMNILETNTGMLAATKSILIDLKGGFASYTYTDLSDERLDQAKEVLKACKDKVIYKILDIRDDINDQGYAAFSFDLIVANFMLHTPTKHDEQLNNIRRLLKPGGYLLHLGVMNTEQTKSDSPLGPTLPCPHISHNNNHTYSLCVCNLEWKRTLGRHGFSDTNLVGGGRECGPSLRDIILVQAVDDRIEFLRNPLASTTEGTTVSEITIVGGATTATSASLSDLTSILGTRSSKLTRFESLESLAGGYIPFGGTVVLMQDHDKPIFEDLDEERLSGLQKMFEISKNVLWVTRGYKTNSPYARMAIAFARCLRQEMSHVRLQVLDLPLTDTVDATLIAQHLLRLLVTQTWEEQGQLKDILWSVEPEISFEDGQEVIPRVKLCKTLNDRYNSARRHITKPFDPAVVPVTLSIKNDKYILISTHGFRPMQTASSTDKITIRVKHSLLKAVKVEHCGYLYLIFGIIIANHEQVIALSSTLSSEVDVPKSLVRACAVPQTEVPQHLTALYYGLTSHTALRDLEQGDSLLLSEPTNDISAFIEPFAIARGVRIKFLSDQEHANKHVAWRSKQSISAALPRQVSRVIRWQNKDRIADLRKSTTNDITIDTWESYLAVEGSRLQSSAVSRASDVLDRVQEQLASVTPKASVKGVKTLALAEVNDLPLNSYSIAVIDWTASPKISMTLEPVDKRMLFRDNGTYWLIGLTGGLGLSLCQWMISRGARNIVISSRNPGVDARWITHFKSMDGIVKVYANDITDRKSVKSIYDRIQSEMLPIIGVCHGAMVLQDALVHDLDMSRVERVLGPKVKGAIHLDEIFQNQKLDFFVMLSSIAAITGNPGQAAYAAANGFLAGLAAQRRGRGLAASTVNLGAVLGHGYVTRGLTLAQQAALQKAGVMWTSEQDFHQAFAEAVVSSPPLSVACAEFNTGVRVCYADEERKPKHASSPIFSHLLLQRDVFELGTEKNRPAASVKVQLLKATTSEDVSEILTGFLTSKLRKALQISTDANIVDQTANTLGIDSLIAVEMRSWMVEELSIDMPVLKIIGGGTMREIITRAHELLCPALIPGLEIQATPDNIAIEQVEAVHDVVNLPANSVASKPQSTLEHTDWTCISTTSTPLAVAVVETQLPFDTFTKALPTATETRRSTTGVISVPETATLTLATSADVGSHATLPPEPIKTVSSSRWYHRALRLHRIRNLLKRS